MASIELWWEWVRWRAKSSNRGCVLNKRDSRCIIACINQNACPLRHAGIRTETDWLTVFWFILCHFKNFNEILCRKEILCCGINLPIGSECESIEISKKNWLVVKIRRQFRIYHWYYLESFFLRRKFGSFLHMRNVRLFRNQSICIIIKHSLFFLRQIIPYCRWIRDILLTALFKS